MYGVTGVNVFPRKLMKFPRKEKVNSVPYPLLTIITACHLAELKSSVEQRYQGPEASTTKWDDDADRK